MSKTAAVTDKHGRVFVGVWFSGTEATVLRLAAEVETDGNMSEFIRRAVRDRAARSGRKTA
jgi:hypothetical protein